MSIDPVVTTPDFTDAERAAWEVAVGRGLRIEAGDLRAMLDAAAPLLAGGLRDHIDTDHAVMVALGKIAEAAVTLLEHVNMDTDEDREFHARTVGALRGQLDTMAATMKEANEAVPRPPEEEP